MTHEAELVLRGDELQKSNKNSSIRKADDWLEKCSDENVIVLRSKRVNSNTAYRIGRHPSGGFYKRGMSRGNILGIIAQEDKDFDTTREISHLEWAGSLPTQDLANPGSE